MRISGYVGRLPTIWHRRARVNTGYRSSATSHSLWDRESVVSYWEAKVTPTTQPTEIRTMTTTANDTSTNLAKFQSLLRDLFRFDCADLDFGIYRIMNHKRDVVERFITEQLPASISAELDSGPLAEQNKAATDLAEAAQSIRSVAPDAIDEQGVLAEQFRISEAGQTYLAAQARAADSSRGRDAVEASIYNHLYAFFNRYYDEGDFISQRRYSRNQRYAIPYNGEEVYLHWANSDQYYVKTDEHFRNYDWQAPNGITVHFRLKDADVEQNNVGGERRFFIPQVEETAFDADTNAITIPFEYRPLAGSEATTYGRSNQQDTILSEALPLVAERLRHITQAVVALTGERRRTEKGEPVSHLEHHLRQYVRRNNSDFFIHKDLAGFLNRELDFYLKNEVLNLDNLTVAGEDMADGWFQQMRLTKAVGIKIIDFLAQIENFQKLLWEKRKFATESQYCITVGNIAPAFYAEIAINDAQWEEWREQLGVDGSDRSETFLREHPTLVLDTKHFDRQFIDSLLASFHDLDGMTDGLLIHSDNWQALRFLEYRYWQRIQSIYVDPPYNTFATKILYKNGFEHSTWMSLMEDRLTTSASLLQQNGMICATIDDHEFGNLKFLMGRAFGVDNHLATIAIRNNPSGRSTVRGFAINHEYGLFFEKSSDGASVGRMQHTDAQLQRYKETDPDGRRFEWENLRKSSAGSLRADRPKQFFPIYWDSNAPSIRIPKMEWIVNPQEWRILEDATDSEVVIWPLDGQGRERVWRYGVERAINALGSVRVASSPTGSPQVYTRKYLQSKGSLPRTWWDKPEYSARDSGTRALVDIFGSKATFDFPKATAAVMDSVRVCSSENDGTVLDYFAGSGTTGHAVISLNREDEGERKFILIEMGDHFDTVLLPRIKKVTYTPEWREGMAQRQATDEEADRSPRIIKYIRLESYEDALDSIVFDDTANGQMRFAEESDEYLLKYMLGWETKDNDTLLNPAKLTRPFSYRLRVHANGVKQERAVDLPETFNYLLGLMVHTREVFDDGGRRYLVYRGEAREAPGKRVVVIWRETEGWTDDDFARDRDFVAQHNLTSDTDTVYVNGDSAIPNAKPIEPMFKARMFAGVDAQQNPNP